MSKEEFPTDRPAVVTCGLPYANGDLHIGHLRGYIGADAFNRSLQTLGQQSAYVCGSDMHGTPVAVNAEKEGVDPEEFALEWHEQYEKTFPKFNVDFDNYGHTHDETNTELTQEIVRALDEEGYIYEKEIQVAYDPDADQYLPDRYVVGTCPYCGEKARGDECDEGCQRHLEPGEVEDPKSSITGNPAEYRERTHKFFEVSEFADYLTDFLDGLEGTSNARNQPREWIEQGLQDWCITRDMDWGIDFPGENPQDLVLYVWVDAPIEYISSTKQYSERVGADEYDWEEVWRDDISASEASGGSEELRSSGGEIIHVIGRDIIQHHAIFWPAMLEGAGYTAPRGIAATGFITINGKGLSTSRNRAVWAKEYLDEGFHPDLLRYYLMTTGGLQQDVDFSWDAFQEKVNGELVGNVGNFLYRSLLFAYRNYEGTPETDVSPEVEERIGDAIEAFRTGVNDYSLRGVASATLELTKFGNEYIQRNEPWNLVDDDPAEAAQVIRDCVQIAKASAVLFDPIAPDKAAEVWKQLGEKGEVADTELEDALAAPPRTFDEPSELFGKIEDERVEELNEKLEARVEAAGDDDEDDGEEESDEAAAPDLDPVLDDRIGFDEFQTLDMRVGRIESADGIEGADELVRLEVDIGVETRQIVAGLKQLHDVDELPGTKVIVMANLEQAELFGVESDGMVLAAGEQADLLTTHEDAKPGTKIK